MANISNIFAKLRDILANISNISAKASNIILSFVRVSLLSRMSVYHISLSSWLVFLRQFQPVRLSFEYVDRDVVSVKHRMQWCFES